MKKSIVILLVLFSVGCGAHIRYTETEIINDKPVVIKDFDYRRTGSQEIQGFEFFGDRTSKKIKLGSSKGEESNIRDITNLIKLILELTAQRSVGLSKSYITDIDNNGDLSI